MTTTIIAIDGTFASGKGTLGKKLAAHYGFAYLDTGKLYRALAYKADMADVDLSDGHACAALAENLSMDDLSDPILKSGPIGANASRIAVHIPVRQALKNFQLGLAANPNKALNASHYKGAILDGRDIGTVICPNADVKLYVDADPKVRAERRHAELLGYGEDITVQTVLAQLTERDHRDMNRAQAPLKPAADAHMIDTTDMGIADVVKAATLLIDAVLKK